MPGTVISTQAYIDKAVRKFGKTFDYSNVRYTGNENYVLIGCRTHGQFEIRAMRHLYSRNGGCPKCASASNGNSKRHTQAAVVARFRKVHGTEYTYARTQYVGMYVKVSVACRKHGDFEVTPNNHIYAKSGCPKCYGTPKSTTDQFVRKARAVHGLTFSYKLVDYKSAREKVRILCKKHGVFLQTPNDHLNGVGCPSCSYARVQQSFSSKAIQWVESEARRRRMKGVVHAANGGEFILPGTRYRVDGYHPRSKTVFEFHGDCFHGNPAIYSPRSKPHPYNSRTARSLYKATLAREAAIRALGYRLIVMWESDYTLEQQCY